MRYFTSEAGDVYAFREDSLTWVWVDGKGSEPRRVNLAEESRQQNQRVAALYFYSRTGNPDLATYPALYTNGFPIGGDVVRVGTKKRSKPFNGDKRQTALKFRRVAW